MQKYLTVETRKNIAFNFTPSFHPGKDSPIAVSSLQGASASSFTAVSLKEIDSFLSHFPELKRQLKWQQRQDE